MGFIPSLVKAVQELDAKLIDSIQSIIARLSGLEERVNSQQTEIDQLRAAVEALQKNN
jgi:polyhydroxyalkanoate synthesis regulator phasin